MAKHDMVGYRTPQNMRRTLARMLAYLSHQRSGLAAVVSLVFVSAFANVFGTYMIKPVINDYVLTRDYQGLLRVIILIGVVYLCGVAATWGYSHVIAIISQRTINEIRRDLFSHLQTLPLSFFDSHPFGELMGHFTNDIDAVNEMLLSSITELLINFILVVATTIMLLLLNWKLALISLCSQVLVFVYLMRSSRMSRKHYRGQQQHLGELTGFIEEMISGQKVEKVFNHESQNFARFCEMNEQLRKSSTSAMTYTGIMVPVTVAIIYLTYALSACVGGLMVTRAVMDIGSLSAFLVYLRQSGMPTNRFAAQINFILAALSGAERIFAVMDESPEIDQGNIIRSRTDTPEQMRDEKNMGWYNPSNQELIPLCGDVRFHNVSFGYTSGNSILADVDLFAKPGQKIAFVGSTGAGKTTIINLISRFYEINSGEITIDGIDIRQIRKAELRHSLSILLQDVHLFSGTIAENIRYGRLDASDEDVRAAAVLARADSFIRRLPQGYKTLLTSDGSNLSQGQRQLLAIARAAIVNPAVLILDEATSSVDTRTERLIEEGLDSLMNGRTVFIIAHRLSTVRNADAILVIENGAIIERGSHAELLALKGRYYNLYTGQAVLS